MENNTSQNLTDIFFNSSDILNGTGSRRSAHNSESAFYVSLCLIWIPGFLTNLLALFFLIRDIKKAVFPAIVLLLVLCVSDLTAVCFSFTRHMITRYVLNVNYSMCASLSTFHTYFKLYSGVMNSLMAVDRVMAICTPFYYKRHIRVNTWKVGCLIAAVAVATLNLFPLVGLGSYTGVRSTGKIYCTPVSYKEKLIERTYGYIFGIAGMAFVFTIVILNSVVVRSVLRLRTRIITFVPSENTNTSANNSTSLTANQTSFEIAFAKLMFCLAAVYLVCETPYNVLILLEQFKVAVDRSVTGYIHLLSGFSYTVDPVVYILIRKTNRKRIIDFFCRRQCSTIETQ